MERVAYTMLKRGFNMTNISLLAGITLIILGHLLLLELFLIYKRIIQDKGVFIVVGTIIVGVSVVVIVNSYYSKSQ